MSKLYLLALLLFAFSMNCFCQTTTGNDTSLETLLKDSLLTDSANALYVPPSSYFQVGFGIGNELYSVHNHVLNAKQVTPPLVLTPTVAYFNKSGFSISANNYLLSENNSFGVNQYSITPSYETQPGTAFDFLFSYTHYFVNNEYSLYSAPIQNDLYSSLVYKKTWLEPGVALGYSAGLSKEVLHLDTVIDGTKRNLYDSVTNNLKLFTTILTVQHDLDWLGVINNNDSILFTPILMLNFGSSNTDVVNNDNLNALLGGTLTKSQISSVRTKVRQRIKKLTKLQTMPYGIQSAGIDFQGSYTLGNFSVSPDVYLDYYLPATQQKRFTQAFVINFAYTL